MLPRASRLHTAAEFAAATRRGMRGTSDTIAVHLHRTERASAARAGFVVSAKVGNSVVRHRVTRRLRPLVREVLMGLPPGTDLVVRALPSAAAAASARLGDDLNAAVAIATTRRRRRWS